MAKLVVRAWHPASSEIAAIGDADSDAQETGAAFERVAQRIGESVLIGSTQKMGTGTNVQKRLVALHHLDAPWKPAEVEQREGRILRQGNDNEEVAVYRYVTEALLRRLYVAYPTASFAGHGKPVSPPRRGKPTAREAVKRVRDLGKANAGP